MRLNKEELQALLVTAEDLAGDADEVMRLINGRIKTAYALGQTSGAQLPMTQLPTAYLPNRGF